MKQKLGLHTLIALLIVSMFGFVGDMSKNKPTVLSKEGCTLYETTLSKELSDTTVTVSGLMPAGTYLTVKKETAEKENKISELLNKSENMKQEVTLAYDIQLYYEKDGEIVEYQPMEFGQTVDVCFSNTLIPEGNLNIGCVDDEIEDYSVVSLVTNNKTTDKVTFQAEHFTTYYVSNVTYNTNNAIASYPLSTDGTVVGYVYYDSSTGEYSLHIIDNNRSSTATMSELTSGGGWNDYPIAHVYCDFGTVTGSIAGLFAYMEDCTDITFSSSINTSGVTDMEGLFKRCVSLTSLNLSNINTSSCVYMNDMFAACYSLETITFPSSAWVTSKVVGMLGMFANCRSLKSLYVANWNVSSVVSLYDTFSCCSSLTSLDLSSWNLASLKNMCGTFFGCVSLKELKLPSIKTVTTYQTAFYGCTALETFDLSMLNLSNATDLSNMLEDCYSLKTIKTPLNAKQSVLLPTGDASEYWVNSSGVTVTELPLGSNTSYTYTKKVAPTYTISYYIDGNLYTTQKYIAGAKIVAPKPTAQTGYTFAWYSLPETMPAYDINVTGDYTRQKYRIQVSYVDEYGNEMAEPIDYTYEWGTWIYLKSPEIRGYTPDKDLISGNTERDINETVVYTRNTYTLTYYVEGEVYSTQTYKYNDPITPIAAPEVSGYTFAEWTGLPTRMPEYDTDVYGTYLINYYSLVIDYIYEDGTPAAETYVDDLCMEGEYFSIKSPEVAGHTPKEALVSGNFGKEDISITVIYTRNYYILTYYVDDEEYISKIYPYESSITPVAEPSKPGHTFSGWSSIPTNMPEYDVDIYGDYAVDYYYLTINYVFPETPEYNQTFTSRKAYGAKYSFIPSIKEGYTANYTEIEGEMGDSDKTITCVYLLNEHTLKIDYVYSDGTEAAPSIERVLKYGYEYIYKSPVIYGYTPSTQYVEGSMLDKDMTLTVVYSNNEHLITYYINGEYYDEQVWNAGKPISLIENPSKEGYNFSGWSSVPTNMPDHDIKVDGYFTLKELDITIHYVDSENNELATPKTLRLKYGETYMVNNPKINGYSTEKEALSGTVINNEDIYVVYSKNQYTVSYVSDGITIETRLFDWGEVITYPENPSKEGYSFNGWSIKEGTLVKSDMTCNARHKINSYTLTIHYVDENGNKLAEDYVDVMSYGVEYLVSSVDVTGYETDTLQISGVMGSSDVEYTVVYNKRTYSVVFMNYDGTVITKTNYLFGDKINIPTDPEKESDEENKYTFAGWSNSISEICVGDAVYTATFTAIPKDDGKIPAPIVIFVIGTFFVIGVGAVSVTSPGWFSYLLLFVSCKLLKKKRISVNGIIPVNSSLFLYKKEGLINKATFDYSYLDDNWKNVIDYFDDVSRKKCSIEAALNMINTSGYATLIPHGVKATIKVYNDDSGISAIKTYTKKEVEKIYQHLYYTYKDVAIGTRVELILHKGRKIFSVISVLK